MQAQINELLSNKDFEQIQKIMSSDAFKKIKQITESQSYKRSIELLRARENMIHKDTLAQITKLQSEIIEQANKPSIKNLRVQIIFRKNGDSLNKNEI
jgi:hypothetical protein